MITQARFAAASRLLHWLMAPMIITMLFIGIGMAASVSRRYDLMVSIHRPLGFAILVLCLARIVNRFINRRQICPTRFHPCSASPPEHRISRSMRSC